MGKQRRSQWRDVKRMIRAYPKMHEQYSRHELDGQSMHEYEAVNAAVWLTDKYPNGKQRLEIIRLLYWCQSRRYTVDGAGMAVGYSEAQARRLHSAFLHLVADYLC